MPPSLRLFLALLFFQFPSFFLGLGLSTFFALALHADLKAPLFALPTRSTVGVVTALHKTPFSEGGGHHSPGTPVYAVSYTYTMPGGGLGRGVSYATGTWNVPSVDEDVGIDDPVVGRRVPIQYVARYPALSRIRGLRSNVFETATIFVTVFLLAGLFLAGSARAYWRRICAALADGEQDPKTGRLRFPEGHAPKPKRTKDRTLADRDNPDTPDGYGLGELKQMTGVPPVRDGRLQPPRLRSLLLLLIFPSLMLLLVVGSLLHP